MSYINHCLGRDYLNIEHCAVFTIFNKFSSLIKKKIFINRSTPCPNVKQADEWGDPANCENGDNCPYCHTRTEQQFHPEVSI